jgi:thiol:disulfide interchange protein DsbD
VGSFLWLAVLLAFVSLLTPCVFPMIPITVSFFTKRGSEEGRAQGVKYALAYGAGIVATYTGFGIGMALLLGPTSLQSFAAHPWTNLAIGALFVFFGLSLMGFYDLKPPAFLARRAEAGMAGGGGRSGYLPVIVMGFIFTVTAFTCTAPIVGSLLPLLFKGGSPWLIVTGMLAYATAFALPFVLLAMFPGLVGRLPGAGAWMITIKVVLGFIELIAALKFFSNTDLTLGLQLMPRPVMLMLTLFITAALALYLFGTFSLPHDVPGKRSVLSFRTLFAVGAVLLCLYLARGLMGRDLDAWTESYLPPAGYGMPGNSAAAADAVPWLEDYEAARQASSVTGRNLFIDFTGVTCVNCRIVEKSVFSKPGFAELMKKVIPAKLYTDRKGEHTAGDTANQKLAERLGSVTLPLYVLMAPDGRVLRHMGYTAGLSVADFARFVGD